MKSSFITMHISGTEAPRASVMTSRGCQPWGTVYVNDAISLFIDPTCVEAARALARALEQAANELESMKGQTTGDAA